MCEYHKEIRSTKCPLNPEKMSRFLIKKHLIPTKKAAMTNENHPLIFLQTFEQVRDVCQALI